MTDEIKFIDRNSPESKAEAARVARHYIENIADQPERNEWFLTDHKMFGGPVTMTDTGLRRQLDDVYALTSNPSNPSGITPTEYKCLVLPKPFAEVSKGGIIIPVDTAEKEKFAMTEGTIVAISHLAFTYATDEEWGDHKPKPGDRVIYGKYAGMRIKGKDGVEYLLCNDKDVVALVAE